MKRNLLAVVSLLSVVVFLAMSFSTKKERRNKDAVSLHHYLVEDHIMDYTVPSEEDMIDLPFPSAPTYRIFLGKSFIGFKEALGFKESRGDYWTVNEFGYLGKYQFAATTLHMIGIYDPDLFLTDTYLQEAAFDAYVARNKWILRRDIKRYVGSHVNGVKVTESGILAAAHLAGAGNVKKYLRSGGAIGFNDAFGTSIGYYLKKFSGYDTSFILANKKAKVKG
ncbi:peptidoglycan-binding protein LysM [Luteirhabdus pelagi]|uniref:peptidoglycan-binding protein LysM n=1 Tax=Luteirhabdus pelagi TaxID=2792783 RepID=UPI001939DCB7|nr:peptidoglycan-binding protein LysM [Luteirhabdus pelagi]MCT8340016.1 peptidoglycan-binding protein LysM [Thermobacterium salinum]